jgi:iron complex outermembrane receptor protein
VFQDRRSSNNWAAYAQDEIALAKPLLLYFGVRYDHYSQFGGTTNPRIGLVYRPWTNTAFKFVSGTAFRAPNCWELYYQAAPYRANPFLRPEKVRTLEGTVEHTFTDTVRLTATFFSNRISQLIDEVEQPGGILIFRNSGLVSANGIETEVEAKWKTESKVRFSYSFVQTRDEIAQTSLGHSPKHLVKLNLTVPVLRKRLYGGLEGQYTSSDYSAVGQVGGYAVVNATAFAPRIARNLDLSFSAYNLFDHKYAQLGGGEQVGPVPQDGRTLRLKLSYRF